MIDKRITVFLGAGSIFDTDGPTTESITGSIKANKINIPGLGESSFIKELADVLERFYAPNKINFEEIFHALDEIMSYIEAWREDNQYRKLKLYSPVISAFVEPKKDFDGFLKNNHCQFIANQFIRQVKEIIWQFECGFSVEDNKHKWYVDFWNELNKISLFDIATLNYDSTMEKVLKNYTDGYGSETFENGYHVFQPLQLENNEMNRIMHLHGSIYYAYPKEGFNIYDFRYQELIKYDNYHSTNNGSMRGPAITQTQNRRLIGSILTGLDKTAKIQTIPYSFYNVQFITSIVKNQALLIVGYSFGDTYLNDLLLTIDRIHGNNKRVVIITKLNEKYRTNPIDNAGEPEFSPLLGFMNPMMKKKEFNKDTIYPHPTISDDKTVRIYFEGLKEAVENHKDEIIDFLNPAGIF